jgi:prolyl 4-hydroxylase
MSAVGALSGHRRPWSYVRRASLRCTPAQNILRSIMENVRQVNRQEIGAAVSARLALTPDVVKAPVTHLDLFVLRDFLQASECDALIALIDSARKPSRLFANNPDPDFRTSETCNLDPKNDIVSTVEARLTTLIGIDPKHGEYVQGQRYAVGQQFKPHHDFLRTSEAYWPQQETRGGQRTWTAMIFLNVPERGGETFFPGVSLKIPPRRGSLVAWNNLDPRGEPNPMTLHQGMKVIAGVKYIVTKWYRERPWGPPTE